MATETSFISFLLPSSAFFNDLQQELWYPMSSLFLLVLSLVSLCFLVFVINRRFRRIEVEDNKLSRNAISCSLLDAINQTDESHQTPLVHPLLVEILALDPPKWDSLPSSFHFHLSGKINGEVGNNQAPDGSEVDKDSVNSIGDDPARSDDQRGKKKKRRSKKKRQNYRAEDSCEEGCLESQVSGAQGKHDLVCFYPFTSSSSATQRKIKHQYDQLVKSHDAKALTLAQK